MRQSVGIWGCKAVHRVLNEKKGSQNASARWLLSGDREVAAYKVLIHHLDQSEALIFGEGATSKR